MTIIINTVTVGISEKQGGIAKETTPFQQSKNAPPFGGGMSNSKLQTIPCQMSANVIIHATTRR
jgi:hypothetical protein